MKVFINKILKFTHNRVAELVGMMLIGSSILLMISLLSYSPEDPNFIYSDNSEVKNYLGLKGSYISDIFFQCFGLISLLIPLTVFFTGFKIVVSKNYLFAIENFFLTIVYIILGSLFFFIYSDSSFWLTINGNSGFLGNLFKDTYIIDLVNLNKDVSYYFLIFTTVFIFMLSANFKFIYLLSLFKKISFGKKIKKSNFEQPVYSPIIEDNVEESRVQENFSFNIKNNEIAKKISFMLPSINFLKKPTKKDRVDNDENKIDEDSLEKILLDFGVEGKIKKISKGPVVTLNEFEPAPGVKVSKVINLSEDIARNTSSESARISTIPGRSTIGIELPKSSRENVYLSEIISDKKFLKKDIKLPIALGKSIAGDPITGDLSVMPHLLIAGTTGSGKSVCINTIILSLLYKHTPENTKSAEDARSR